MWDRDLPGDPDVPNKDGVAHQNGLGSNLGKTLRNHPLGHIQSKDSHLGTCRGDGGRRERSVGREREEIVGMATSQKGSQEPEEG